jgi:hypothetical protein
MSTNPNPGDRVTVSYCGTYGTDEHGAYVRPDNDIHRYSLPAGAIVKVCPPGDAGLEVDVDAWRRASAQATAERDRYLLERNEARAEERALTRVLSDLREQLGVRGEGGRDAQA